MTTRSKVSNAVRMALLATTAATIALSNPLVAAEQNDEEEEEAATRVTVVGSRIKRTQAEGAQPITVITNEDMAKQGHVTVFDALTNLTQNSSFQFEGPEAQLFTPDVQTLNLRGFGVGNTLVLLNGRRISSYPAAYQASTSVFNIGAIPRAAVQEIRVLSTGASAIYGSDAVAGVVDIILKQDVDETTLNLIVGTPTEADSNPLDIQFDVVTGKTFDNGNLTVTYNYEKRERIKASDFDAYDSDLDFPYGEGVLTRGVLNLNQWQSFADPSTRYVDPQAGTCEALGNGTIRSERPNAGFFCGYDGAAETNFRNGKEAHSLFLHGDYTVGDTQLFADVLYYQSESNSNNRSLTVSEDILDVNNVVPTVFGFSFPDWYLAQRRFTEEELGMSLDQTFEDNSLNVTLGARGSWGYHDWEFYVNRSEYEYEQSQPWWKAEEVINVFLGDLAPVFGGFGFFGDPWWDGNGSFGLRDNLFTPLNDTTRGLVTNAIGNQTYGNETSSTSAALSLTGDLFEAPAGMVQYAAVLEYEKQEFAFVPDARIQQDAPRDFISGSGWWKLTGYQGEGDRDRLALGVEFLVPITDTFNMNLAARADKYDNQSSSIGTKVTPALSFEWRPSEDFLLRGGYTESFRAPDLNQVYTTTGFFTGTRDLVQCREAFIAQGGDPATFDVSTCDAGSSFVQRIGAQELGGQPLKDETGHSAWFGFSWELGDDSTLMATLNRVSLDDRVFTESVQGLLNDEYTCSLGDIGSGTGQVSQARCDYVNARIQRTVNPSTGISFVSTFNATPINIASQEIDSLDVNYRWGTDTDYGRFDFLVDYSLMIKNEFQSSEDAPVQDLRDDPIAGGWDPRSRVTTTLAWNHNDLSLALTAFRRGTTTVWRPSQIDIAGGDNPRIAPYITYNLTAGYTWNENFSTRLRVRNLLDQEPPKDETFLFFDTPWYNYFVYAGAGIGREVYLEATYQF